jgi:hypothetical protein
VRLFGRRETLTERLLREGGLDASAAATAPAAAPAPSHGLSSSFGGGEAPRQERRWDLVTTVEAQGLAGDEAQFTALPDRSLVVPDGEERNLTLLADAVEQRLPPPYRARAVRQRGALWALSANRIDVVPLKTEGDMVELAMREGERTATVDGEPVRRGFPELERLGERAGRDYAIRAERLEGRLFEVRVDVL